MDSVTVLKIEPLKEPEVITINNSLVELQTLVGGDTEVSALSPTACIVLNEHGIQLKLTPNRRIGREVLLGTILIVGAEGTEIVSLTPEQIQQYTEQFRVPEVIDPREKLTSPWDYIL